MELILTLMAILFVAGYFVVSFVAASYNTIVGVFRKEEDTEWDCQTQTWK